MTTITIRTTSKAMMRKKSRSLFRLMSFLVAQAVHLIRMPRDRRRPRKSIKLTSYKESFKPIT